MILGPWIPSHKLVATEDTKIVVFLIDVVEPVRSLLQGRKLVGEWSTRGDSSRRVTGNTSKKRGNDKHVGLKFLSQSKT